MGSYLENYLDSVSSLPQEVRRNFTLLRELDVRSQELIDRVEKNSKIYLKSLKKSTKANSKEEVNVDDEKIIRGDLKQCVELSDEKVALAVQTYELVDKHIRRLDMDLKKFEAELELQGTSISLTPFKEAREIPKNTPNHLDRRINENGKTPQRKKAFDSLTPDARVLNVDIDMPIDPNEPTYCFCNRVSFGEMVGCDSSDCKVEWFHFECVGLTQSPKGKWYCPDCTAQRKKQRI